MIHNTAALSRLAGAARSVGQGCGGRSSRPARSQTRAHAAQAMASASGRGVGGQRAYILRVTAALVSLLFTVHHAHAQSEPRRTGRQRCTASAGNSHPTAETLSPQLPVTQQLVQPAPPARLRRRRWRRCSLGRGRQCRCCRGRCLGRNHRETGCVTAAHPECPLARWTAGCYWDLTPYSFHGTPEVRHSRACRNQSNKIMWITARGSMCTETPTRTLRCHVLGSGAACDSALTAPYAVYGVASHSSPRSGALGRSSSAKSACS